jgi:methylamine dehydrogenase accessory protein MauD
MTTFLVISSVLLWVAFLFVAFLTLGALKAMTILRWQLDQLQATTPTRKGRGGLKIGAKAPAFTLPTTTGTQVSLGDYDERKVFLVFVQPGCGPCHTVVPDLNRLQHDGQYNVLVINNGELEAVRKWVAEVKPEFPVLIQEKWGVSKSYEVLATPFAFLINEQGVIVSKGLVSNKQYMGFVLESRAAEAKSVPSEGESDPGVAAESPGFHSLSLPKEVEHV